MIRWIARLLRCGGAVFGLLWAHFVGAHPIDRLLDALDLDYPGLEAVRAAHAAGDPDAAHEALLVYYAERPAPAMAENWLPAFVRYPEAVAHAEGLLRGEFEVQGVFAPLRRTPNGDIDWDDRGPRDDPEWAWMLNRHTYFQVLYLAWEATGESRFLDLIDDHLIDWVAHNPYPRRLTFDAGWRPLEVARRILNSWTHLFFKLQDHPSLTPEARLALLASLPEHADALANHYSFWGGNHLLTETTALTTIAVAWPEFRDAEAWKATAVERYHREFLAQTYPDGAFKELTNHYQKIIWLGAYRFVALLAARGQADTPEALALIERVEAVQSYFAQVRRPDGRGPLNSASDLEDNRWQMDLVGAPIPPLAGTLYFPWAGHAVTRDRTENPREWAFFDLGPYGSAHQHRDALSLEVYMDERWFLADRGRYVYQPGPWSAYFKGPTAHNVVLIDDEAPLPGPRVVNEPLTNTVEIAESHSLFIGQAAFAPSLWGKAPAHHRRALLHLPGDGWLVLDATETTGTHQLTTWWQFAPGVDEATADAGLRRLAATDARGPLGEGKKTAYFGSLDPIAGWHSEQFGEKSPALAHAHTVRARGPSLTAWHIVPATSEVSIEVTAQTARRLQLELRWPDGQRGVVEVHAQPGSLQVDFQPFPATAEENVLAVAPAPSPSSPPPAAR